MIGSWSANLMVSLLSLMPIAAGTAGGSSALMALGFLGLGTLGVVNLFTLVQEWRLRWSLCAVHGSALLAWYGLGTFIGLAWGDPWLLGMSDDRDYGDLFSAGLFVLLAANAILALAPVEQRWWRETIDHLDRPARPVPPPLLLSLAILWMVLLNFVLEGRIDFRGFGAGSGELLPIAELLVLKISLALAGYFGWLLGKRREGSKQPLVVLALLYLPLLFTILMGQGRREIAVHIIAFFLIFAWSRNMRLDWKPLTLFFAVAIPLMFGGSMLFQAQRLESQSMEMSWSGESNLIDRMGAAAERFEDSWDEVLDSQITSFPTRMFIIGYIKELMGTTPDPRFGHGAASAAELVMGIPAFLYPGKGEMVVQLGGIGEMRNPDFDLADHSDYADSLLTVAYMDFGWFGIPCAALLTLAFGWIMAQLARLGRNELFQVVLISLILTHYLTVEQSFVATTVNVLRLAVAVLPVTLLLSLSQRRDKRAVAISADAGAKP